MSYRDPRTGRFTTRAKYLAGLRRRRQRRGKPRDVRVSPVVVEETADEWQFGSDYSAARRGHDVMVDVRLTFDKPVTKAQAQRAVDMIVRGYAPAGVHVEAVDWKSGKHVKSGDASDLENFLNVLYVGGVDYLRAGAVKKDEL